MAVLQLAIAFAGNLGKSFAHTGCVGSRPGPIGGVPVPPSSETAVSAVVVLVDDVECVDLSIRMVSDSRE